MLKLCFASRIKHFHEFYHLLIVLTCRRSLYSTFFVFEKCNPTEVQKPPTHCDALGSIVLVYEMGRLVGEDEREWISANLDPLGSQAALIYR